MAEALMRIEVVFCPGARELHQWTLELPPGALLADALASVRAQWPASCEPLGAEVSAGIWSRKQGPGAALRDGDRVEIYRPLRVDPKVARRERFNRQGSDTAGLFARKRPGAKQGY